MKEPLQPETNRLVESGYDRVSAAYARLAENDSWPRMRWLRRLLTRLGPGAAVLDIGCGSGLPADAAIAEKHRVTGIDISRAQIDLARRNVPAGRFVKADLSTFAVEPGSFDAVVSFYTVEHVPRSTHLRVFQRIASFLKPGGYLLLSVEAADYDDEQGMWLGVPMFLSVYRPEVTKSLVEEAGFRILETGIESQFEGDHDIPYLWILARQEGRGPR